MRPPTLVLTLTAVLGLAGCATTSLHPAPGANVVAGERDAAFASASNVQVTVRTRAWHAYPTDLPSVLTPLEVTLENRSGRPLSVRYQDFTLVGANGFRYSALPTLPSEQAKRHASATPAEPGAGEPMSLEGGPRSGDVQGAPVVLAQHGASPIGAPGPMPMPAPPPAPMPAPAPAPAPMPAPSGAPPMHSAGPPSMGVAPPAVGPIHRASPIGPPPVIHTPRFYAHNFYVAPYYGPYYPGLSVWAGPFLWDPFYYDRYYYGTWQQPLPSQDMLELALPEGVLQDGGAVRGFVYFSSVKQQPGVTFHANLVDASTNTSFGAVDIPLVVAR